MTGGFEFLTGGFEFLTGGFEFFVGFFYKFFIKLQRPEDKRGSARSARPNFDGNDRGLTTQRGEGAKRPTSAGAQKRPILPDE